MKKRSGYRVLSIILATVMLFSAIPMQTLFAETLEIETVGSYTAERADSYLINNTEQVEFDIEEHSVSYDEEVPYMEKRRFISSLAEGDDDAANKLKDYYDEHTEDKRDINDKITDYIDVGLIDVITSEKSNADIANMFRLFLVCMEDEKISDENKQKILELIENGNNIYNSITAYVRYSELHNADNDNLSEQQEVYAENNIAVVTDENSDVQETDSNTYINDLSAYVTDAVIHESEVALMASSSTNIIDKEIYKMELYGGNNIKTVAGNISIGDRSGDVSYSRQEVSLPGKNGLDLNLSVQYSTSEDSGLYRFEEEDSIDDSTTTYFSPAYVQYGSIGAGWSFSLTHLSYDRRTLILEDGRSFRLNTTSAEIRENRYNDFEDSGVTYENNVVTYLNGTKDTLSDRNVIMREDKYGNKIHYEYEDVPAAYAYCRTERRLTKMYDDFGRTITINYQNDYTEITRPDNSKVRYYKTKLPVTYANSARYPDAAKSMPVVSQIKDMTSQCVLANFEYDYKEVNFWRGRLGVGLYGWDYNIIAAMTSYDNGNGGKENYVYAVNTITKDNDINCTTQCLSLMEWTRNNDKILEKFYQYNESEENSYIDTVTTVTNGNNVAVDKYTKTKPGRKYETGEIYKLQKSTYERNGNTDTLKKAYISKFKNSSKMSYPEYEETKIYNKAGNYIKRAYRNSYNENSQLLSSKEITSDTGIDDESTETYGRQTVNTYKNDAYSSLAKTQIKNSGNTALVTTVYTTNSLGDVTKQEIFNGTGGVSVENVEYTYDGNHNMIKKENKNGSTVLQREEYEYSDEYSNVYPTRAYTKDTSGNVIASKSYEYKFNKGLVSSENDGLDNITAYTYDSLGRLTKQTNADGTYRETYYNNIAAPKGYEVYYENDYSLEYYCNSYGKVATVDERFYEKQGDGYICHYNALQTIEYDNLDRPVSVWNNGEGTTTISYDAFGRQTEVQYPNYSESMSANSAKVKYYDVFLEGSKKYSMIMSISPENKISCEYYDEYGRVVKKAVVTNPSDLLRLSNLDNLVQMPSSIKLINTATYEYDDLDRVITEKDGENRATTYTYNAAGKVLTVSVGNSSDGFAQIQYTYDKAGRVTKVTQGTHITTYTYDLAGRVTRETDPMGYYTLTRYDIAGNVINFNYKNSDIAFYTYDRRNRMTQKTCEGLTETYTYDKMGNILTQTNKNGTVTYQYRFDGVLEKKTMPDGKSISYTYNTAKQKTGCTDYFGNQTSYTYYNGKVKSITQNGNTTTNYYNRDGSIQNVYYPNGNNEWYNYDYAGRLSSHGNSYDMDYNHSRENYTYDNAGNIIQKLTKVGDTTKTVTYEYDSCNRLTQESVNGVASYSYGYDRYGNRSYAIDEKGDYEYIYDANNRLTKRIFTTNVDNETEYTYDKNGNLLRSRVVDDFTDFVVYTDNVYQYDAFNNLINIDLDGTNVSYTYYADGLRATKTYNGTTTQYYYDGQNVVNETLNGSQYATNLMGVTGYISRKQNGTIGYYDRDGHGDTVNIYGADGTTKLASYEYDAFGNQNSSTGTWKVSNPIRYCGEYYDSESGLIYLRARYYDSENGRFISEDPAKDGYNWYSYCGGNPVMFVDPSGLDDYIFYTTGEDSDFSKQAEWQKKRLEAEGRTVIMRPVNSVDEFQKEWDIMGYNYDTGETVEVDMVVIYSHGNENCLIFEDGSATNAISASGTNSKGESIPSIYDLKEKNIGELHILSCNSGHLSKYAKDKYNTASAFSTLVSGVTYGYDGNVSFGENWFDSAVLGNYASRLSNKQKSFHEIAKANGNDRVPIGKLLYRNGKNI